MDLEKNNKKLLTMSIDDYIHAVYQSVVDDLDIDSYIECEMWDEYAKKCFNFMEKFDFLLTFCRKKKMKNVDIPKEIRKPISCFLEYTLVSIDKLEKWVEDHPELHESIEEYDWHVILQKKDYELVKEICHQYYHMGK